jgi:hypothetical protein
MYRIELWFGLSLSFLLTSFIAAILSLAAMPALSERCLESASKYAWAT